MTDENAKIKYNHLKNVIAGKYSTERYDVKDLGGEINLDKVSNDLLKSDAMRNLAQLIKARPNIDFDGTGSENQKKAKVIAEAKAAQAKLDEAKAAQAKLDEAKADKESKSKVKA